MAKSKLKSKAPSKSNLKSKPKSQSKTTSKSKPKLKPKSKSQPKVQAKLKSKPGAKSVAKKKTSSTSKSKAPAKSSPQFSFSESKPPQAKKQIQMSQILTPLDDRVVVQITEAMRKTAGGLFIPDTVTDVSGNKEGTVIAVGRGHKDKKGKIHPMDVKVGDKVIFSGYAGSRFQWDSEELLILRENELLGVVNS